MAVTRLSQWLSLALMSSRERIVIRSMRAGEKWVSPDSWRDALAMIEQQGREAAALNTDKGQP